MGSTSGKPRKDRASAGVHSMSMVVFMAVSLFGPSTVRRPALKAAYVGFRRRRRVRHGQTRTWFGWAALKGALGSGSEVGVNPYHAHRPVTKISARVRRNRPWAVAGRGPGA